VTQQVLPRGDATGAATARWSGGENRQKPQRLGLPPNRVLVRLPHFGVEATKSNFFSFYSVVIQDFRHHAEVCNLVGMEQNLALRERNAANK
jgi:hypothetical protein